MAEIYNVLLEDVNEEASQDQDSEESVDATQKQADFDDLDEDSDADATAASRRNPPNVAKANTDDANTRVAGATSSRTTNPTNSKRSFSTSPVRRVLIMINSAALARPLTSAARVATSRRIGA